MFIFDNEHRYVGSLEPIPRVFDYKASIVRNGTRRPRAANARRGMLSSSKALMDATKKLAEKAMPVILTTLDEVEIWMTATPDEALKLQRPLPDESLRIVARGVKEDAAGPMA